MTRRHGWFLLDGFVVLLWSTIGASPVYSTPEQIKPLHTWEFSQDAQGWQAANSIKPLSVADSALQLEVTGDNPHMVWEFPKQARPETTDRQMLVIEARVKDTGVGEFSWSRYLKGHEIPFGTDTTLRFQMLGDQEFRSYYLMLPWQGAGKVTKLRFDPPSSAGQSVQVRRIGIYHLPAAPARGSQWQFANITAGFGPVANVARFAATDAGLSIEGIGPLSPEIVSPRFSVPAENVRFFSLRAATRRALRVVMYFTTDAEPGFSGARHMAVDLIDDGLMHPYLLDLARLSSWRGRITRIRLQFENPRREACELRSFPPYWQRPLSVAQPPIDPVTATIESVSLDSVPAGPARLTMPEVVVSHALLDVGIQGKIFTTVRNAGSQIIHNVTVECCGDVHRGNLQVTVKETATVGDLEPGESRTVELAFKAVQPGPATIHVVAKGPNQQTPTQSRQIVVATPLDPAWKPQPGVKVAESVASIATDRMALVWTRVADKWGGGRLMVCGKSDWRTVATLPSPMRIFVRHRDAAPAPVPVFLATAAAEGTSLVLSGAVRVEGVSGQAKARFSLEPEGRWIESELSFTPDTAGELLRLDGPSLRASDGISEPWQVDRSQSLELETALFPGLEYLEEGERSSSGLDVAPPWDKRWSPHPNRITVPLMASRVVPGDLVGLMWDMRQMWDGRRDRPTAVFAVPNFLDGQANTLLGLFLPGIPEHVPENGTVAARPYRLEPSKELKLTSQIFALPDAPLAEAMRLYYARHGVPSLPASPRSYDETIVLSLKCYEELLWQKDKGWQGLYQIGRPIVNPAIAVDYLLGEQILGATCPIPNASKQAIERVGKFADLTLALHAGGVVEPLRRARASAYATAQTMNEDYSWSFEPSKSQRDLGRLGRSAVGLCATRATLLLKTGQALGDAKLIEAGLHAAAGLARFRMPRGAQSWEVPLHSPDLLASAQAVEALVLAHRITEQATPLRQAVYWAETGLPFVYAWDASEPGPDAMRYATVPAFGSSFFSGTWMGRSLQWVGLEYASTLLRLAPHDRTHPWKQIAEGITLRAMREQTLNPKCPGCFPDHLDMTNGWFSYQLMLSPQRILRNVFLLIGHDPEPQVAMVSLGKEATQFASIVAAGRVTGIQRRGEDLVFSVAYPAGQTSYVAVVGLTEPMAVRLGDREVPKGERPYDPDLRATILRLSHGDVPLAVTLQCVKHAPMP